MKRITSLALAAALAAGSPGVAAQGTVVDIEVDFSTWMNKWTGASSDYIAATAPSEVVFRMEELPAPADGHGVLIAGRNHSADLFLYIKRRFEGLRPVTNYQLSFKLRYVSSAPKGCMGTGGAPGESVWMKVGAAYLEPRTVVLDGSYTTNFDHGVQAGDGRDMIVVGTLATSGTDCGKRRYEEKTGTGTLRSVRTDGGGGLWLIVGMDSGYEAGSLVYLRSLSVRATPQ
jgi:hypothetical protein